MAWTFLWALYLTSVPLKRLHSDQIWCLSTIMTWKTLPWGHNCSGFLTQVFKVLDEMCWNPDEAASAQSLSFSLPIPFCLSMNVPFFHPLWKNKQDTLPLLLSLFWASNRFSTTLNYLSWCIFSIWFIDMCKIWTVNSVIFLHLNTVEMKTPFSAFCIELNALLEPRPVFVCFLC